MVSPVNPTGLGSALGGFTLRVAGSMLAVVLLTAPELTGAANTMAAGATSFRSATKARDIGGFALGMGIRDAAKLSPLTAVGDDDYQTVRDGIEYDFGVTRLGRIYRVDSAQHLGRFKPDATFMRDLTAKLTAKYGPPTHASVGTFNWTLIEPVKRQNGETLPIETNWASAYFDDGPDVTVHVKLIDFRIMWQDDAALSRGPRDDGSRKVVL